MGFSGSSGAKESSCDAGDPGSIPGLGRSPGGGHGNLLQYSCFHRQSSLAGYSPWGRKESDTTERLSNSIFIHRVDGLNVRKGPQTLLEDWIRIRGWGDLPGGPVVRTVCFPCQQPGFDPWLGN